MSDPKYMFVCRGIIQWLQLNGHKGVILCRDWATATATAKWLSQDSGKRVSVAEIGSVEGETLYGQLDAELRRGADCAWLVEGVEGDDIIARPVFPPKEAKPC